MRVILLILIGFSLSFARVVVDEETNLMWQDDRAAAQVQRTWRGAQEYCQNLTLGGYSDWFLPTHEQLLTITDKSRYAPAIKSEFQNVTSGSYWSSSPDVSDSENAWYVRFKYGDSSRYRKTDEYYVRCARAGQSDTLSFENFPFDRLVSYFIAQELDAIPKPSKKLQLIKDEFETTAEFQKRVTKTKQKQKQLVAAYQKKVLQVKARAKERAIQKALEVKWGKPLLANLHYDADNGYFVADVTFEAKKDFQKKIAIKVARKSARGFKQNFATLKPEALFSYDGRSVQLQDVRVPYAKKTYVAQFTDMSLDETAVAVNLRNDYSVDTTLNTSISIAKGNLATLDRSKLKDYHKLERLLSKTKAVAKNSHRWLFTIGIEQYEHTDNIAYAKRTAEMFKKVMQKRLGVPESNSFTLLDAKATQADIKIRFKKLFRRVKR